MRLLEDRQLLPPKRTQLHQIFFLDMVLTNLVEMADCKRFSCSFAGCNKSFKVRFFCDRHMMTHRNERPFICTVDTCDARFNRAEHLKRHAVVHTKERNFRCPFEGCGKTFSLSAGLQIHERRHLNIRTHKCPFTGCGATFVTSTELQVHLRTHTNERPYACEAEGCTARFALAGALQAHRRTHSGDRPFLCTYPDCDSKFTTSSHLRMHERIHSDLRPYKCPLDGCAAAFRRAEDVKIHMIVHTSERKYRCTEGDCESAFKHASVLWKHKFLYHTPEGQTELKKEEARVRKVLKKAGLFFKDQHTIDFVCTGPDRGGDRAYIDFLIEIRDLAGKVVGFVFLEVDERQHQAYTVQCEVRRMADVQLSLAMAENTFPIMFIRYNPNAYRVNGKAVRMTREEREKRLVDYLRSVSFVQPFAVTYMYYDVLDGLPAVFDDPSYNESFKTVLGDVIF